MGYVHEQRTTRNVFHKSSRWLREPPRKAEKLGKIVPNISKNEAVPKF
jgi:hypothetical protein